MNLVKYTIWSFISASIYFIPSNADGQKKDSVLHKWSFHSYTTAGILTGGNGPAFECQTINGMGDRSWFAGLGIGIDYYQFRSVPVFIDLRKSFYWKSFGLYGYADGGMHFPWVLPEQHSFYQSSFSNGFYGDIGLGLLMPLGKCSNFLISFGYSLKEAKQDFHSVYFCPMGVCSPNHQIIYYELNRFSIKMGISF
jgi:hypothetical protein